MHLRYARSCRSSGLPKQKEQARRVPRPAASRYAVGERVRQLHNGQFRGCDGSSRHSVDSRESTHARRECGLHETRHSWRGWSVHRACKRVRQLCGALQAGGRLALRVRKKREQPTKRERPTRDDSLLLRSAGHKRVRQLAVRHTAHSWLVGSSRARIV